jgi:hypothetical protein
MANIFSTSVLAISLAATGVFFSSTGCHKKKDTIAKVYVRDASNNPVVAAQVVLEGQNTNCLTCGSQNPVALYDTTTTNGSGEAIFNFNDVYQLGQAGVAVLDIKVTKGVSTGTGIIKVEQETTSEETVFM